VESPSATSATGRPPRLRALAAAALLVPSGAAALAHEAAWLRLWVPVTGAGVRTASAVVAGTLIGLAAGAALGGRLADRSRRPGLVFAAAEALGALLALAVLPLVALAASLQARVPADVPAWALAFARVAGVAAVSALPSAALGASLPAAVGALSGGPSAPGSVLARLYAWNTAGAVLGVLASTGWTFEAVGNRATVLLAAATQVAVAVLAWAAFRRGGEVPAEAGAVPEAGTAAPPVPPRLVAAAALAGAAGLAVEIAWVRRLTPALGTTTYAFGAVLGAFLVAVALGSWVLGPRRAGRPAGSRPAWVLLLAALPAAALPAALGPVASWAGERAAEAAGGGDPWGLLPVRAAAAAAVVVPSALLGAAGLPWLLAAASPGARRAGRGAGAVLAGNGAGSALAAAATGALALPLLGSAGCLRAAGALYAAAAACAAPGRGMRLASGSAAAVLAVLAALPLPDGAALDAMGATFDTDAAERAEAVVLYAREGRVATVAVREREGRRELWVDGNVVASAAPTDRMHLALLGHLPMLAHRDPRRVAVVGLGTGITATACADHRPAVLDVFELEPEVVGAAESFRPVRGGLPGSARLAIGDGRDLVARSAEPYDVVTSDPIHPAIAGSATLYTLEHYRALEARLAEGGVVCQWLPLYEMETSDVRMVLRTFAAVFEPTVFVAGQDLVILGTRGPLSLDPDALAARIDGPVRDSLAALGLASPGRLLGLLLADAGRARRFAGEGPLNTDDKTVLEFTSARARGSTAEENLRLLEAVPVDPRGLLARAPRDAATLTADLDRARRLRKAMAARLEGGADALEKARDVLARLAAEDPADGLAAVLAAESGVWLAGTLVDSGRRTAAREAIDAALAGPGLDARLRTAAAQVLADLGDVERSRAVAREALLEAPRSRWAARLAEAR
jgi:spermidine synthase